MPEYETVTHGPGKQWICCQLGAREHYVLPRVLDRQHQLKRLYTDTWWDQDELFPGLLKRLFPRLAGRYHPALSGSRVTAFTKSALWFELREKCLGRRGWQHIFDRNRWFQLQVAGTEQFKNDCSNDSRPVVFSYSYAALEIIKQAKANGCYTVLGQIDGGPVEEEIIAQANARYKFLNPPLQGAPAAYWNDWHQECQLADWIIVNSSWSRSLLIKAGIDERKLTVVPLMYEKNFGAEETEKLYPDTFTMSRPLRVLFLGSLIIRKGIAEMFEAVATLQNQPVEFLFVGSPGVDAPRALKNNKQVKWIGPVPVSETGQYYRMSDIFILPTLSDGFGLTQVEAMAHGLPVIASRHCGEVVEHEKNGLLLPEVNANSIVQALTRCLDNPALLPNWSHAALKRSEAFTPATVFPLLMGAVV